MSQVGSSRPALDYHIDKSSSLKIIYTNSDVLHNKLNELEIIASNENADIIAITETLLKNMPPHAQPEDFVFKLKGYTTIHNYNGRGLCLFIKDDINFTQTFDYDEYKTCIFITVKGSKNNNLTVGVIYRSPNSSLEDNHLLINIINSISKKYLNHKNKLIIMGDFNFPGINWDLETTKHISDGNNIEDLFLDCVQRNFLYQMVSEPTHLRNSQTPTLIDLVLTNDPNLISDIDYNAPLGNSHHSTLNFKVFINTSETSTQSNNKSMKPKYLFNKGDYDGMRGDLQAVDWNQHFQEGGDVNTWNNNLEAVIFKSQDKFIPKLSCKPTKVNKPKRNFSAPQELIALIQSKRKAFRYFKKFPTTENMKAYHYLRNLVNAEIIKAKRMRETEIAKLVKTNPKMFYRYVNNQIKPVETVANLLKNNNEYTKNDQEKADTLNEFFSSVFVKESDDETPDFNFDYKSETSHIDITEDDVFKALKNLNISKSPGPDGMHPRVLKELARELAHPLHRLFNKSIQEGRIPDKWKVASVKPLFKKGRKDQAGNYRPVSLTSITCKLFETFVRDALYKHLLENSILSDVQYGFCKQRSTVSQLLVTLNEWFYHLDNRTPVDALYLDFKKAFDSVPHKRLLTKLHGYGIRGKVLQWVESFLTNRVQYVDVNNNISEEVPVTSGVPQGSVLGPCLFIYFINDLPEVVKCLMMIFADDTKAYRPIYSIKDNEDLQMSLDNLVLWTKKWLIGFNSEKCKVLHLGSNNPKYKYTITNNDIISILKETTCEKDIGVYVDSNLNFDTHVTNTVKSARKLTGLLCRTISYKSPEVMLPLYKSLVRMILEHANVVWAPYKKKYVNMIEKVQRHFTKLIHGMKHLSYEERLVRLQLPSLVYRRLRGDYIETFKILTGIYDPLTTKTLLTTDINNRTRNNSFKLVKPRVNYKPYQEFFTNRIISGWNRLPSYVVKANSLNSFKNRLDHYFKDIMFKIDLN